MEISATSQVAFPVKKGVLDQGRDHTLRPGVLRGGQGIRSIQIEINTRSSSFRLKTRDDASLTPKIILQTHNIILIRGLFGVRMLPDFSNDTPVFEAYQAVALALFQADHFTHR